MIDYFPITSHLEAFYSFIRNRALKNDRYVCICMCAEPRFVGVHLIPESDNPEDDKIYMFFRENAIDGEQTGKATHARIGQLCKVR